MFGLVDSMYIIFQETINNIKHMYHKTLKTKSTLLYATPAQNVEDVALYLSAPNWSFVIFLLVFKNTQSWKSKTIFYHHYQKRRHITAHMWICDKVAPNFKNHGCPSLAK